MIRLLGAPGSVLLRGEQLFREGPSGCRKILFRERGLLSCPQVPPPMSLGLVGVSRWERRQRPCAPPLTLEGLRLGQVLSPPVPTPPTPWDKISKIWPQGEDKHSQGWGIKLPSAGFFLKLAFASDQTNQPVYGFPKSDVKSDTLTLSPDKISGLLP